MIELRWMRSVIWKKTSQGGPSQSSVNICRTDRGVLSWSIDINLPWSRLSNFTFHSYNNIEILLFCQIWSRPEVLSVLIINPGIPCTYGNIAYIDINCKNNRQMPAAWKVWRIGVKIPFVFALPAPSQCPHTLCIYSPQLSCPGESWRANRKTQELEQGLTVGQLFCFSN